MKFVSTLLLMLGYAAHCLGAQCTADDLCANLPARICDPASCLPVTQEQLIAIGDHYIRPYTWNKAPKPFVGYCPNKYIFNITKADYNSNLLKVDVNFISTYGANCSNVTTGLMPFTAEADPITKKVTVLNWNFGGSILQGCIVAYDDTTTSKIFRLCRIEPPPPVPGMGYGCLYAELTVENQNPSQVIHDYIENNLDVDWAETVIECTF